MLGRNMGRLRSPLRRLERAFQLLRRSPRGLDPCADIGAIVDPKIIFDVGAKVGRTAAEYLSYFPVPTVYCFEPAAQSVAELRRRLGGRVSTFQLAFGSKSGR